MTLFVRQLNNIFPNDISNIINRYVGYNIISIMCKHLKMSEIELSKFSNNNIIAFIDMTNIPGFKYSFEIRIIPITTSQCRLSKKYMSTLGDEIIYSSSLINAATEFHYYCCDKFGYYPNDNLDFILNMLGIAYRYDTLTYYNDSMRLQNKL